MRVYEEHQVLYSSGVVGKSRLIKSVQHKGSRATHYLLWRLETNMDDASVLPFVLLTRVLTGNFEHRASVSHVGDCFN